MTVPRAEFLPGVHGLRGIAALAILAYHVNQFSKIPLPGALDFVGWEFGHAVHLFFVISGFSLLHSQRRHGTEPGWRADYAIRRLFRIAPLFYAMLLWYLAFYTFSVFQFPRAFTAADVALNVTFLFGLIGSGSLVWAGWTVGVEMIFYALFPVLYRCASSLRSVLTVLVISCIASYVAHRAIAASASANEAYVSFASNLGIFLFGFLAFQLHRNASGARAIRMLARVVAVATIVFLCLYGRELRAPGRPDLFVWAAAFAVVCAWQAERPSRVVASAFLGWVGERSFSVYLIHPQVLYFLRPHLHALFASLSPQIGPWAYVPCLVLATAVTLAAAEVAHRSIEAPGIRAGRAILARRRARAAAESQSPRADRSAGAASDLPPGAGNRAGSSAQ